MGLELLIADRERGLSLVEALVALLILALVSVSILGMFTHGVQLNASGSDYTNLVNTARDQLEELVALPYTDALLAPTPSTSPFTATNGEQQLDLSWFVEEYNLAQGQDTLQAAIAAGTTAGNVKIITLTVSSQRGFVFGRRDVTIQGIKIS